MTRGAISGPSAHAGGDPSDIATRAELASALTRLRELSGLSVRDLARSVDSPVATVGGYFSGRHLPTASQSAVFLRMLHACGVTDPDEQQRWWEAVGRVRRAGRSSSPTEAPYLGLESFQVQDAALFFGRERLTAELVEVVRSAAGPAGRMVAVVGPSGSGKSSLVRAGLIPALDRDGLPTAAVLTPGDRPLHRLAQVLVGPDGVAPDPAVVDRAERDLRADPSVAARWPAARPGLLVVDQFEEVFTSCPDETERRAFIAALCAVAGVGDDPAAGAGPAPVVIVLRADFYGQAIGEAALLPVLSTAQVVVGPMTPDEVRRAVVEPARLVGCEVDPELVEVLIRDLTPHGALSGELDAGALPLLSHALSVTWQRAARRRLTVAGYLATGGIAGAVAQSAEAVFTALTTSEREVTARLFLRLVNVDDDAVVTRRRMPLSDLPTPTAAPTAADGDAEAEDVVDRFVAARLLTIDAEAVQISHEALLEAWPRLQGWIDGSRVALAAHRRLGEALAVWRANDRDPSALLGRVRLATVQDALAGGAVALTPAEAEFLATSEAAVADERSGRIRRARRRRLIVSAMTALAVLASGLAVFAVVSNRAATTEQQAAADYRDLVVAGDLLGAADRVRVLDPNLADQLTITAYRKSPTVEGRSALLDATAQPLVTRMLGAAGPCRPCRRTAGSWRWPTRRTGRSACCRSPTRPVRPCSGSPGRPPTTRNSR